MEMMIHVKTTVREFLKIKKKEEIVKEQEEVVKENNIQEVAEESGGTTKAVAADEGKENGVDTKRSEPAIAKTEEEKMVEEKQQISDKRIEEKPIPDKIIEEKQIETKKDSISGIEEDIENTRSDNVNKNKTVVDDVEVVVDKTSGTD